MPPSFVLDASFALPWIFRDENNAHSRSAWKALIGQNATAFVPAIWFWEITNVLVRSEKRARVTSGEIASFFAMIEQMPIKLLPSLPVSVFTETPPLMRKHDLSAYDAGYLAASLNQGLPLATLDKSLRRAAKTLGIETLGG